MTDQIKITKSSGNIFAALKLPNPDQLLAKTQAIMFVKERMAAAGMRQADLARRAGLAESHVSEMLAGRLNRYGIDRINKLMAVFGASIETETRYSLRLPEAAE